MFLRKFIKILIESVYVIIRFFQREINADNLMSIFIYIIVFLYVFGFPSIPAKHCNFNVKIEHSLTNEGFHRILNYFIDLANSDENARWLYEDCLVGIEQTFPAGVYASADEIKTHKCIDLIHSIFKMPVNTELFAEDASPIMLQLFGHVTNNQTYMHIHIPVHARYHQAKAGGRAVRYEIPHPKMYLSCPNKKLEECGDFYHGLSDTNNFCQQHVSIQQCHWKQIPADVITAPLYWYVAVGDLQHYYFVTFGTTLVIIVGSLYLLKTIHEYKICVEGNKKKKCTF